MNKGLMNKLEHLSFDQPDEVREFPDGRVDIVKVGDMTIGRITLQPGWRWSTSVKPIVGTESCEASHFNIHLSGVLIVRMDDGTELEFRAGDVGVVPPGHDAWVEGDVPVVGIDIQGMADYAKRQ